VTYKTLEEIESKYTAPENETSSNRKTRLKSKQQTIRRFNNRQKSSQSQSTTTSGVTVRKQKSRALLTVEQKKNIKEQHRINE
jgi:hypothetical protein